MRHIVHQSSSFINPHIKWSILNLLCQSMRLRSCFYKKVSSPEAWGTMVGGRGRTVLIAGWGEAFTDFQRPLCPREASCPTHFLFFFMSHEGRGGHLSLKIERPVYWWPLRIANSCTVWGGNLFQWFFCEFHRPLGCTAVAPCPSKQGNFQKTYYKIFRNKLPPQTVQSCAT